MARVIVNLTLPVITEAIDSILECYPQPSQRHQFSSFDARQELVAYVLSRFPCSYTVMDDNEQAIVQLNIPHYSQEQRMRLEALIHQAIQYFAHKDFSNLYVVKPTLN